MIVERRTFYAKAGKAQDVVKVAHEFLHGTKQGASHSGARVLTDLTGRTDRVIVEMTFQNLTDFENHSGQIPPELGQRTMQQLASLVDGAEVEFLSLEYSE